MADPSELQRFIDYAQAFEVAFWSDAWDGIAPFFADDARHLVHAAAPLGCDDRGRDAVVRGLRESVATMDRRFDVRIPEVIEGPEVRSGEDPGIWMRYALTLRRKGLPEVRFEGTHMTRYDRSGKIREIEEHVEAGAGERVAAYLARHDGALRPAGSAATPPADPRDAADAEAALQRSLARAAAAIHAHA